VKQTTSVRDKDGESGGVEGVVVVVVVVVVGSVAAGL
jgi:hypothetical protein